jgi:hypothetical protein
MPNRSFIAKEIIKNESFKSELKRLLKTDAKLQPTILELLNIVEQLRNK